MPRIMEIHIRRDISQNWYDRNPILEDGEPGYEKDTKRIKIGDGQSPWNDLDYIGGNATPTVVDEAAIEALISNHVNSVTPHPVYDDGPSLLLLYENRKV